MAVYTIGNPGASLDWWLGRTPAKPAIKTLGKKVLPNPSIVAAAVAMPAPASGGPALVDFGGRPAPVELGGAPSVEVPVPPPVVGGDVAPPVPPPVVVDDARAVVSEVDAPPVVPLLDRAPVPVPLERGDRAPAPVPLEQGDVKASVEFPAWLIAAGALVVTAGGVAAVYFATRRR